MDAKGTLYITDRYSGSQHIYRIPYNASGRHLGFLCQAEATGIRNLQAVSGARAQWASRSSTARPRTAAVCCLSPRRPRTRSSSIPVNADGTVTNFPAGPKSGQSEYQYLLTGLTAKVMPMDVDVNGNLYFIENPYVTSCEPNDRHLLCSGERLCELCDGDEGRHFDSGYGVHLGHRVVAGTHRSRQLGEVQRHYA